MVLLENGFICLHIGTGYHSPVKINRYKKLYNDACIIGSKLLNNGKNCQTVVEAVCTYLEDSELTNAGYGSNLVMLNVKQPFWYLKMAVFQVLLV